MCCRFHRTSKRTHQVMCLRNLIPTTGISTIISNTGNISKNRRYHTRRRGRHTKHSNIFFEHLSRGSHVLSHSNVMMTLIFNFLSSIWSNAVIIKLLLDSYKNKINYYKIQQNSFLLIFILIIPCIVNDLQIFTLPTNAQFYNYLFHSLLSPTSFGLTAIIREQTPILLELTTMK
jgi:hypothetical protein